jgi:hypothetical protein
LKLPGKLQEEMEKLRIVVGGFIGLYATGGVTWDYIQYPLGLQMLGHDVFYIEDTMQYSKCQTPGKNWDDASDSVAYLKKVMKKFGLEARWAYRDVASGKCFGLSLPRVLEICRTADVFLNVSSATHILKEEYLNIPKRVMIDSDPMFTQVQYWDEEQPERAYKKINNLYALYNYRFSFGENIGKKDCRIPLFDLTWWPTRQPICLPYWKAAGINPAAPFTTVMNWSTRNKMKYKNEEWGQKDVEFQKVINLPQIYKKTHFKMAVSCSAETAGKFKKDELEASGWEIVDPTGKIKTVHDYKSFIRTSLGEFSVAKETYVKSNSGWFSCRSACYLATGRPVITQQTQWAKYIPEGLGLLSFVDTESAVAALKEVNSNVKRHARAARQIAEGFFDSSKVLPDLLNRLE